MIAIHPYLNFAGTTEAAFNFYKSVIGGDITMVMRFGDMQDDQTPEAFKDKICHISLALPNGTILMGTDALECHGQTLVAGNNFSLSLGVDNTEEADRLFAELSAGGSVQMPMQNMFWGDYFGMVTDQFGTQWMISYNTNQQK